MLNLNILISHQIGQLIFSRGSAFRIGLGFDATLEQLTALIQIFMPPGPLVEHPTLYAAFLEHGVNASVDLDPDPVKSALGAVGGLQVSRTHNVGK